MAEKTLAEFGRVDLVANIAGIMVAGEMPIWEITADQWARTLRVNLEGVINGALVFVPILAAQGRPTTIINMGSISSYSHAPWRAPYNTSKIAVAGFTEALRFELAERHPDVRVMLVCPSAVATNLTPSIAAMRERMERGETIESAYGKVLTADEVAAAIVEGKAKGEFWVFTHVGTLEAAEQRTVPILDAMKRQVGRRV